MTPRCDYCGKFLNPDDDNVLDIWNPVDKEEYRHRDCDDEVFAKGMASVEAPEGGWRRGSDMDRI